MSPVDLVLQTFKRERILRGVGGQGLACGCLIGDYETYSGRTLAILDAKGTTCRVPTHRVHARFSRDERAASRTTPR